MSTSFTIPRLMVAAPASGCGKTTITAGLIAALQARGLIVQPFKCGPDYIDPSYHALAAGRPCRNLDAWMLGDAELIETFVRASQDADIAVIEGVMGLYDGCAWDDERGSTAHIAKLLGAPVLLVVDISGAARSACIPVLGSLVFDPDLTIGGAILNLAGSESHAAGCGTAITDKAHVPILGWLPRDAQLRVPERHLGLVPGTEHAAASALISSLSREASTHFDLGAIEALARSAGILATSTRSDPKPPSSPRRGESRPVLAVARDDAFCFYYPENLELLADAGCEIEFFQAIRGEAPSPRAAGVYLGGGYPELHARALSSNRGFLERLCDLHASDAPIYAECGGFMVLTESLTDLSGDAWPMAGLIAGRVRMNGKLAALGYRYAAAVRPNLLVGEGESLRTHEFRHSSFEASMHPSDEAWSLRGTRGSDLSWRAGIARGNLLASYLHVHFGQNPDLAHRFADRLRGLDHETSR